MDEIKALDQALDRCKLVGGSINELLNQTRTLNVRYNTEWVVKNVKTYFAENWPQLVHMGSHVSTVTSPTEEIEELYFSNNSRTDPRRGEPSDGVGETLDDLSLTFSSISTDESLGNFSGQLRAKNPTILNMVKRTPQQGQQRAPFAISLALTNVRFNESGKSFSRHLRASIPATVPMQPNLPIKTKRKLKEHLKADPLQLSARSSKELLCCNRNLNHKFIKLNRSVQALSFQMQRIKDFANRQKNFVHANMEARGSRLRICTH